MTTLSHDHITSVQKRVVEAAYSDSALDLLHKDVNDALEVLEQTFICFESFAARYTFVANQNGEWDHLREVTAFHPGCFPTN